MAAKAAKGAAESSRASCRLRQLLYSKPAMLAEKSACAFRQARLERVGEVIVVVWWFLRGIVGCGLSLLGGG